MMEQNTVYWIVETQTMSRSVYAVQTVTPCQHCQERMCVAMPVPATPGFEDAHTAMDGVLVTPSILGALRDEIQQGILGALRDEIQHGILGALRHEIQHGILGALREEKEQPIAEAPQQRILGALRNEEEQPNAA